MKDAPPSCAEAEQPTVPPKHAAKNSASSPAPFPGRFFLPIISHMLPVSSLRLALPFAIIGHCLAQTPETLRTESLYLSGHGKDDAVPWEFFCSAGRNSGRWTHIPVPSCWETEGFGAFGYQDDPVGEQGLYRHKFRIPSEWKGKVVRIVFDGVLTDTEVKVNGRSAGPKHQGGFYRFAHDITDLIKPGEENLLEVTVDKVSADKSVNIAERRGDYWNFSGIFRPVRLEALPATHVERIAMDAKADGTFSLRVFTGGDVRAARRVTVRIPGLTEVLSAPASAETTISGRVSGQKNWTAENPALYDAVVAVESTDGRRHETTLRFGFRTVETRPGQGLFVNGSRVLLKGANRHSFWPETGRTLSARINRDDVLLMKEMNMNAVRMSHYPPDAEFLDLCDELGLYVINELAGWHGCYDTEVGAKLVREMLVRDINHPSILFWDNGNEGGWNKALDGEFGLWDPQGRRVLHPWAEFQGIDTAHYEGYEKARKLCAGKNLYMPTEFLHGLYDGGAGAGLDDYWSLMAKSPVCMGGFIWALVDEGVVRPDKNGMIDCHGNRAPDGIVGPHREHEGSFNTIREIWSPVQVAISPTDPLSVRVENRYDFNALDRCSLRWTLATFSRERAGHTVLAEGKLALPAIAPNTGADIRLPLPESRDAADVLYVTAFGPDSGELWTWSRRLKRAAIPSPAAGAKVTLAEGDRLVVRSGERTLEFDKRTGLLAKVSGSPFANGPRVIIGKTGPAKDSETTGSAMRVTGRAEGDTVVIRAVGDGPMKEIRWTISPGARVKLDYRYRCDAECHLAGVHFDLPQDRMKSVRFLGEGPFRVWKNRMKGTRLDVWENEFKTGLPGEQWLYPEFKGYFADWEWATLATTEGRVTLATADAGTFLGLYRPDEGKSPMSAKCSAPESGIAILDAIPAMGNKFGSPANLGPQSLPNPAPGERSRTVYLTFE